MLMMMINAHRQCSSLPAGLIPGVMLMMMLMMIR